LSSASDADDAYRASIEGRYCLVRIPRPIDGAQPRRIELAPKPGAAMPVNYATFFIEVMRSLTVLNILFPERRRRRPPWWPGAGSEQRFNEYYGKLADLALLALGQDQIALGVVGLKQIQNEIVERETARIKSDYMRTLGCWALLFAAASGVLCLVSLAADPGSVLYQYRNMWGMLAGSCLGTWISFGIRPTRLQFFDLTLLRDDQFDPPIRLIFVAAMTLVIGLILRTGAMKITIGSLDTSALQDSGALAFLVGCFCGLSEKALPSVLTRRATQFVSLVAGADREQAQAARQPRNR
jgi:hypothetical protein